MTERTRIVKDPVERRGELLLAAEELFLQNGFDGTMVSDIVKKVGVAQGTFYYYFKSKEEVLAAILENSWERFAAEILKGMNSCPMSPVQKLLTVLGYLFPQASGVSIDVDQFRLLADPEMMQRFHVQVDEGRIKAICPIIQGIVREGIEQGQFRSLQYPDEVSEIVFYGINTFAHRHFQSFGDPAFVGRAMSVLQELLERILGIQTGSLKLSI